MLAILIISVISSGGEEETVSKPTSTTMKEETKAENTKKEAPKKEESKKQFTVGQEVKVGNLSYTVKSVKETNKLSSVLGNKTTNGKFVIVELVVKNYDKKARVVDSNMFKVKTADGTEYSADLELDMYVNEGGVGFFLEDINPNLSKTGKVVFELPADAAQYNLEVSSGFGWAGGKYEQIKLK